MSASNYDPQPVSPSAALRPAPRPGAGLAVYLLDRDLRVVYANAPLGILSGTCAFGAEWNGDGLGCGLMDHLPPECQAEWDRLARHVLSVSRQGAGAAPSVLDLARGPGAGASALSVLAEPVYDGSGAAPAGILLVCHEVTEPSGATEQATDTEAARLDVARQLAVTLNHEINNPLFIVSATLEDLQAELDDPEIQRRLKAALDAVWRVASAVKQLQEIRQLVSTAYVEGLSMIDLRASQEPRDTPRA